MRKIICVSLDKDLLQIPGWHYNFVKEEQRFVSPFDGLRSFYGQIIAGDGADNIPSFDGKMRNSVPQFVQKLIDPLKTMTEEVEMYKHCAEIYKSVYQPDYEGSALHRNAQCLYILKEEGKYWLVPNGHQQENDPS